jgi:hypothetical protein
MLSKRWPVIRAVLVTLHLLAMLVLATPNLGSTLSRDAWKQPTVQHEFEAWAARLSRVGFDVDAAGLEEWAWGVATRWSAFRATLNAPFQPYAAHVGVRQRWRMFAAPHRFPERLEVEVRRERRWEKVFVMGSSEHRWRSQELEHDRMRSALFRYGWPHYRDLYKALCGWLAARATEDFPDADVLRCRLYRAGSPTPEEARAGVQPEGAYEAPVVIRLRRRP